MIGGNYHWVAVVPFLRAWVDRDYEVLIMADTLPSFHEFLSRAGYSGKISDIMEVRVLKAHACFTNTMVTWHRKKRQVVVQSETARWGGVCGGGG